jgi:RNA polymerase sigma-70 factor (ECF subfamily)
MNRFSKPPRTGSRSTDSYPGATEPAVSRATLSDERSLELELSRRCVEGDPEAWDHFFRSFRPFLNNVALRLCRQGDEAEELVSRIIVLLMDKRKLALFSGQGSLRGWLRSVMVNQFLDDRRKAGRNTLEELTHKHLETISGTPVEKDCAHHFEITFLEDVSSRIALLLNTLPIRKAGFLNLYYFQRKTLAEAAELMGVHESTASRWNQKITAEIHHRLCRFLRKERGWEDGDITFFMEKCLQWLAQRLERLLPQKPPAD